MAIFIIKSHQISLNLTKSHRISHESHQILPNLTISYRISQNLTESRKISPYLISSHQIRPTKLNYLYDGNNSAFCSPKGGDPNN